MRTEHENKLMTPPANKGDAESELATAEREYADASQYLADVTAEEARRALSFAPKGTASVAFSEGSPAWSRINAAAEQVDDARVRLNRLFVGEEGRRRAAEAADEATKRAARMAAWARRNVDGVQ
jgi:hypothetical protein